MHAFAWVRLAAGPLVPLGHGDWIGRSACAALLVEDPRVSEAHAFVSLRGGELRLLGLRGRFRVGGQVVAEATLCTGLEVELADGLVLVVAEVVLPDALIGVEAEGLAVQPLVGTATLYRSPVARLRPGWHPDGEGVLWSVDDAWRLTPTGGTPVAVHPGSVAALGDWTLRFVRVPLAAAGAHRTLVDYGQPVALEACFYTVRVRVGGAAPAVIGGVQGRILSELIELAGPVSWELVARAVWGEVAARASLRGRWDIAVNRLRVRLRALGARPDLVHLDGAGHVQLLLHDGDVARVVEG